MNDSINKVLIGASGIIGTSATPEILQAVTPDVANLTSVIIQILIGIATLFGLLKKKKVA